MDVIRQLPDHVANQIAAGEVVQRPASVVKELLENAVDAGAKDIQLIVKDAGKTHIQVIDNGVGMSQTDVRMAFERHATSKIRDAADLFQLTTKGFRGEALASIAAVAHVRCLTRKNDEAAAHSLHIEGGKVVDFGQEAHPVGTSIEVKNLFYNIPARRQFLKSDSVELNHITDEFQRVALAHTDVAFRFYHNNTMLFHLHPGSLKQRIIGIFGKKIDDKLVPVDETTEHVRFTGFTGKPDAAKKRRGEQFFFVNNRFIRYQKMHYAVMRAYEDLLPSGTYPPYFIFIDVNPATIDVNIHPTKTEIQFNDENMIFSVLASAVKHSLGKHNVAPSLDFELGQAFTLPSMPKEVIPQQPTIKVNKDYNPFSNARPASGSPSMAASFTGRERDKGIDGWESLMIPDEQVPEAKQANLWQEEQEESSEGTYVLANKFIVQLQSDGIQLIHPRRAHERILYESLMKTMHASTAPSQQLLFPQSVHLSLAERQQLEPWLPVLVSVGFDVDIDEDNHVQFFGLPVHISESSIPNIVEELLRDISESDHIDELRFQRSLIKNLAKNGALRSVAGLSKADLQSLVRDLLRCEEPQLSLHGKPIMHNLRIDELEKIFH